MTLAPALLPVHGTYAADAASSAPTAARPRIGLALSGGGARGAAHIGVLEVLEQMRVPVDCITGTSMGALVGGAYASGMTTADMRKLVAGMSTQLLFQDKPPRQDQTIRRKLDDRSILFGLEQPPNPPPGDRLGGRRHPAVGRRSLVFSPRPPGAQ